jgi:hypothetical protein
MHPYNGQGDIPTPTGSAFVPILSTTNTNPLGVTTAGAHGFNTGDTVEQEGCDDPNANTIAVITVTGASSYTLNGIAGTLAGGAHGYAFDYEVQPAIDLPDNITDLADATVAGAIWEALANAIPFLYRRLGRRRIHQVHHGRPTAAPTDITNVSYFAAWSTTTVPTAGNAAELTGAVAGATTMTALGLLINDVGGAPIFEVGDELDISYEGNAAMSAGAAPSTSTLILSVKDSAGHIAHLTDTGVYLQQFGFNGAVAAAPVPFNLRRVTKGSELVGLGLVLPSTLSIGLACVPLGSSGATQCSIYGPAQISVVQMRTN